MTVINNFLPKNIFEKLQKHCNETPFQIVQIGDKEFSVLNVPDYLFDLIKIDNHEIVLAFIRSAYSGFDNENRIHADNIINGSKIDLASVLYINETNGVTPNGTCFYSHVKHGKELKENVSEEEFNRLLTEDSNNDSKWIKEECVSAYPNRLLKYNAQFFHAKYPKEIMQGIRIVLVCFYKKTTN